MKPSTISNSSVMIPMLQEEIRRSELARYDHRLHGVLLVAEGLSCRQVSDLLGDAPRTVQYWVERFEERGLQGLADEARPGRPSRLNSRQMAGIDRVLRKDPRKAGMNCNLWDGKTLSTWIHQQYRVRLETRQCQRMFRHLGFRLRKPRPMIAQADPQLHRAHKKTPAHDEES